MTSSGSTIITTMTTCSLDDSHDNFACNSSIISQSSTHSSSHMTDCSTPMPLDDGQIKHKIYIYQYRKFIDYVHSTRETSESVCIYFCHWLNILPTTRLIFGLCVYESADDWLPHSHCLQEDVRYALRIRYKVPKLDKDLQALDQNAFVYLHYQMRHDMVNERIKEIIYPLEKDKVMGLGVLDMYIDFLEGSGDQAEIIEEIEKNYKTYLPKRLIRAHRIFVKPKICNSFSDLRNRSIFNANSLRVSYVEQIHNLAPDYLMERYSAEVDYIPPQDSYVPSNNNDMIRVFVKLDLLDDAKPCLKISRIANEKNLKWYHLTNLESIYTLCVNKDTHTVSLQITELRWGYPMKFSSEKQLASFVTYLTGYIRLTTKWMEDLCIDYVTPSLKELIDIHCHGPIGGNFSFAKLRQNGNKCGSYLVRQCEKEYDVYYIDINIKCRFDKFKTETFKIERKVEDNINGEKHLKWLLHYNDSQVEFDSLKALAHHIPITSGRRQCIHPSKYDKPPLLLICLPKNLQSKKTENELGEIELQRRRPQIFDPSQDLIWYRDTRKDCDNGKMFRMRADWRQEGSYKDVCVTLKVLQKDTYFQEFMKLAHTWSNMSSPHLIKLYGLTLSTPYTMVMEYAKYGALNEFLQQRKDKIHPDLLVMAIMNLLRGIIYLREKGIVHGYIRCCNLYVTCYNPKDRILQTKICDPGFPRPYRSDELPWIPLEYYNKDLEVAKNDPSAEAWAFATTIWEIITYGQPIINPTPEDLSKMYNDNGAILKIPDNCQDELREIIMDGWSRDAEKRFDHHHIFSQLTMMEEKSRRLYEDFPDETSDDSDSQSIASHEFYNSDNGHCELINENSSIEMTPSPLPSNSSSRSYFDHTQSALKIPGGKVIYKNKIGEGHYGIVYLGELHYNSTEANGRGEQVAIKTLKTLKSHLNKDFKREIQIMLALDHPNIVKIKQWVEKPIAIIMEYVEGGSFSTYLNAHKPTLTNKILLHFALHIAMGMEYLCQRKIIHRDLAARNILVDRDLAKISDFGLAQPADADGYYLSHTKREIPIRWYSPESIRTNKFSFQSDVWSYGVTLFEMFSRGDKPNLNPQRELEPDEILNQLEQGVTLPKPELCPDIVYMELMKPCWHIKPKMRPDFKTIREKVHSIAAEFI